MSDLVALVLWLMALACMRCLSFLTLRQLLKSQECVFGTSLFLLLSAYGYWLLGSFWVMGTGVLWLVLPMGAVAGIFWLWGRSLPGVPYDIGQDLCFWGLLLLALCIRGYSPDIDLGEKYADLSIFQAVLLDLQFPPQDRWLSGHSLNYYYFSQLLFVPWVKLLGIPPEQAVNLITSTVAAMIGASAYGLIRYVGMKRWPALCGCLAAIVLANWEWLRQPLGLVAAKDHFWWWDSSRAITNTITEFPFFSFLLGDFHAHYTAIPWMTLTLLLIWLTAEQLALPRRRQLWLSVILTGLAVGSHYPINPWGLPVMAGLTALYFGRRVWATAIVGLCSWLAFLPYWLSYQRPAAAKLMWINHMQRSHWLEFCLHWGLFLVVCFVFLALSGVSASLYRLSWQKYLLVLLCGVLSGLWLGPAVGVVVVVLVWLLLTDQFVWCHREVPLVTICWLLIVVCELFTIDQTYGERYIRMNTVFKAYIIAWWGLALGLPMLLARHWPQLTAGCRRALWSTCLVAVVLSLVYPVRGTSSRLGPLYSRQPTLNGLMVWSHQFPGEYAAINWIRQHTEPKDVIWEVYGPGYSKYARISTFSGRPTIIGWLNHQQVWRSNGYGLAMERVDAIAALIENPTLQHLQGLLAQYQVAYIAVGQLEHAAYSAGLLRLIRAYPVVFANEFFQLHQVVQRKP